MQTLSLIFQTPLGAIKRSEANKSMKKYFIIAITSSLTRVLFRKHTEPFLKS